MRQSHTAQSYYQATANRNDHYASHTGDVSCDVLVIGGGYTGLSAALELALAGYKVVVLEAGDIGAGASGRNGGQICTGFSPGQSRLETQVSKEDARRCFDIAEEAKRLIEQRIATYKIDCDLQWGYLHCALKPGQDATMQGWIDEYEALGYHGCELLTKEQLSDKLGTSIYHGAMRESRAGHFHPLNYLSGLAAAAATAGVVIPHRIPAPLDITTGASPSARTGHGKVSAKFMIIAGNGYLGRDVKPLYGRVMPVTSFIVVTEPLGENRAHSLIRDNEAVADTNFILDYFRRTADNRLLFGGTSRLLRKRARRSHGADASVDAQGLSAIVRCEAHAWLGRQYCHHFQSHS